MKVGILTYHRSHNYGTMLQAAALWHAVSGMGHETFFVDYWPDHQRRMYAIFPSSDFLRATWRNRTRIVKSFCKTLGPKLSRRRHFFQFFASEIKPHLAAPSTPFDVIVYGSDQIWRRQPYDHRRYNPVYFGQDPFQAKWRVAYAASMGNLPTDANDTKELTRYFQGLDRISVRESDLRDFILNLGLFAEQTIDPVFLLSPSFWEKLAGNTPIVRHPYLLHYDLQRKSFDDTSIRKIAAKHKLEIVKVYGTAFHSPRENERTTDGPYQFLNLVRYAELVATSSFHGIAFSLMFKKPFWASFLSRGGRATSLLESVGLKNRLLEPRTQLPDRIPETDWDAAFCRIDAQKTRSLSWLKSAISSCEVLEVGS